VKTDPWNKILRLIVVLLAACVVTVPAVAQTTPEVGPSLIPMRLGEATRLVERFKRSPATQYPDASKIQTNTSGRGHIQYIFEASDGTMFLIDANTGDVDITYRGFKPVDEAESKNSIIDPTLIQIAAEIRDDFYWAPKALTMLKTCKSSAFVSLHQADGSTKKVDPSFSVSVTFGESPETVPHGYFCNGFETIA